MRVWLAGDANGDEVCVGENVFSQFDLEGLDVELGEDAGGDFLCEGFDEFPA